LNRKDNTTNGQGKSMRNTVVLLISLLMASVPFAGCLGDEVLDEPDDSSCDIMEMVTDYRLEDGDGFTLYGFEEEINLEQCDFSGMDFSGWSIGNVNFVASNMVGANFNDSYISQVNFEEALLTDATFENASIHNLLLKNAGLSGVDLSNTILTGPHAIALSSCPNMLPVEWDCLNDNLVGPTARLIDANLSNLDLSGMNLTRVSFHHANLQNADLDNATLDFVDGSNLMHCPSSLPVEWDCLKNNLVGPKAMLYEANLSGLDLSNRNLSEILFWASDLTSTNFSDSNLSFGQIISTIVQDSNFSNSNLTRFHSRWLFGCPNQMPTEWTCMDVVNHNSEEDWRSIFFNEEFQKEKFTSLSQSSNWLLGPGVSLSYYIVGGHRYEDNATVTDFEMDFSNLNLSTAWIENSNFEGANFSGTNINGTVWMSTICPNGMNSDNFEDGCLNQKEKRCHQNTALASIEDIVSKRVCGIVIEKAVAVDAMRFIYDDGTYLDTGRDTINTSHNNIYWELPENHAISRVDFSTHHRTIDNEYGLVESITSIMITTFEINGTNTSEIFFDTGIYSEWANYETPHEDELGPIIENGSFFTTNNNQWIYFIEFASEDWANNDIVDAYHYDFSTA
jgi:uncharacterized protein YjbI with pentapeptide repeats